MRHLFERRDVRRQRPGHRPKFAHILQAALSDQPCRAESCSNHDSGYSACCLIADAPFTVFTCHCASCAPVGACAASCPRDTPASAAAFVSIYPGSQGLSPHYQHFITPRLARPVKPPSAAECCRMQQYPFAVLIGDRPAGHIPHVRNLKTPAFGWRL